MAAIFVEAPDETYEFVNAVMVEHFTVLATLQPHLEIEILMASDPKTGVGLKFHGHPAAARIKVLKPEDRAAERERNRRKDRAGVGVPDVRLLIDNDRWLGLSERSRTALIHHELMHVVPKRDKKSGQFVRDEFGRVKLRLRPDDWMLTGFEETSKLFGDDALEVQSLKAVRKGLTQLGLTFSDDLPPKTSGKGKPAKVKVPDPESSEPTGPSGPVLASTPDEAA